MITAGKDTGSVQRSVGCGWRGGGVTRGVRSGGGGTRFESHRYGRLVQTGDRMSRRSDHLFATSLSMRSLFPHVFTPRSDVFTFVPDVFSPRPDVFTFAPNVFTPRSDVFTFAPDVFSPRPDVFTFVPDVFSPRSPHVFTSDVFTFAPNVFTPPRCVHPQQGQRPRRARRGLVQSASACVHFVRSPRGAECRGEGRGLAGAGAQASARPDVIWTLRQALGRRRVSISSSLIEPRRSAGAHVRQERGTKVDMISTFGTKRPSRRARRIL